MEASSRLRTAQCGERLIMQARADDEARIERIAKVRDARIVAQEPVPPSGDTPEGLVNFVLEKCAL